MTDSPKVHGISGSGSNVCWYTNDILGNRTSRNDSVTTSDVGAARYGWDKLGRMLYAATPSGGSSDYYRADGQRIEKVANASLSWTQWTRTSGQYDLNLATSGASSRYFYDGQMGMEDDYNPSGSVTVVNRYGLGARGIDRVERTEDSSTTYGYPLYDGHGNMRAVLAKSGSSYTTGNWRTYDVWGSLRSGGSSSDPTQGYCANLGHVSDADSGLIYMRARYHEPSTGRFISQDPAKDGWNWFVYCRNSPCGIVDGSGRSPTGEAAFWWLAGFTFTMLALLASPNIETPVEAARAMFFCYLALASYALALNGVMGSDLYTTYFGYSGGWVFQALADGVLARMMYMAVRAAKCDEYSLANGAVLAVLAYSTVLIAALAAIRADELERQ